MHLAPLGHPMPQPPQSPASVASTQIPLHRNRPGPHWHTPLAQMVPLGQALPQLPQWLAFEVVSTQVPLQTVRPSPQFATGRVQTESWHTSPAAQA
jgi:hypothetical protein